MRGPFPHTGEKNGMPFQISTSPSRDPCQPISSLNAARGKTMYRPALRITRYPSRQLICGWPAANDVRMVTSMPA